MSQYNASMIVVNATANTITGTAQHWSGDGSGHLSSPVPALTITLPPFSASNPVQIVCRNDHSDYWIWTPATGVSIQAQKNLDQSAGGVMLVTDNLLVVVTSANGVGQNQLTAGAAGASAR
jgi:hypothetical protein